MRLGIAQINPTIGDIAGNTAQALAMIRSLIEDGATVILLPELAILGYPPRDLLLRQGVVDACETAVVNLAREVAAIDANIAVIIGHPARPSSAGGPRPFVNRASVLRGGRIIATYDKRLLPGYDVFDEDRYFSTGDAVCVVELDGVKTGIVICEDLWRAEDVADSAAARARFAVEPVRETVNAGADLLLALSASPFVMGKGARHHAHLAALAREHDVPIVLCNQVGANDDLIFDGRSMVIGRDGSLRARLAAFETEARIVEINGVVEARNAAAIQDAVEAELWHALVLGVRDYCRKTGSDRTLVGLSGGLDSSLVAAIAAAALGPASVTGILMPSRHSSDHSISDAEALAANLDLGTVLTIPIEAAHRAFEASFNESGAALSEPVANENLQARIRGLMLMAVSNDRGGLVLATGNKSEMATGYTTLYGDMCGALAVIGDVLKTTCYDLARWINANHAAIGFAVPPIPENVLTKPPSAELRPNQTDQDSLPPYEALDAIIAGFVDREESPATIAAKAGLDAALVERWCRAIDRNEYKRNQSAVVLKVSPRTFGPGRPMPIVMKMTTMEAGKVIANDAARSRA